MRFSPKTPIGSRLSPLRPYWSFLFLYTLITFCLFSTQSDTWWLLRAGEALWHGDFVTEEYWSFTAQGNYWPNHEAGFEAFLYAAWKLGGDTFIIAGAFLSVALVSSVTLNLLTNSVSRLAQGREYDPALWAILGIMSYSIAVYRPNVVSVIFFSVLLYLLARKKYFWLPLIFLLWANFHAGVLTGLILISVIVVMAFLVKDSHAKPLLYSALLSTVITLVNPLGYKLWLYIFESSTKVKVDVTEFQPLWENYLFLVIFIGTVMLTAPAALRSGIAYKEWDAKVSLISYLLFALATIFVIRFYPFFVISSFVFLARAQSRPSRAKSFPRWRAAGLALLIMTLVALGLSQQKELVKNPLPQEVTSALRGCSGHFYNDYESGAYLLWFERDLPVYQDNRWDPYPKFIQNNLLLSSTSGWESYFEKLNITCALTQRADPSYKLLLAAGWTEKSSKGRWVVLESA